MFVIGFLADNEDKVTVYSIGIFTVLVIICAVLYDILEELKRK